MLDCRIGRKPQSFSAGVSALLSLETKSERRHFGVSRTLRSLNCRGVP